jgi:hypothetical protein
MISTVGKFTQGRRSAANAWHTVAEPLLLVAMLLIGFAVPAVSEEVPLQAGSIDFPLEVDTDATGKLRWILLPPDHPSQLQVSIPEARPRFRGMCKTIKGSALPRFLTDFHCYTSITPHKNA